MATPERSVTLYLRNVPAGIVREAKIKAAREGTTLTGVVIEALARSLEAQEGTRFPSEDQLGEDMKWYQENRALLLRRYAGEYVAIVDRAVIDHDEDFESLATRVFSHAGVRSVFMPRVTEARERVRVRSPRRRKS